jgi:MoxR-like ATPase
MTGAIAELESALQREIGQRVIGGETTIRALVTALVARGHVLIQGAPGLGKTLVAKSLAQALGGEFKRIQGTADLMPSDIIGVHVYDDSRHEFVFRRGPVFADVLLVDEINRAGPKTQSALLEAMEERQISIERELWPLPDNFLVIATQNPHEFEGTYPLPESQLDRFMLRIDMHYPEPEAERRILARYGAEIRTPSPESNSINVVRAELLAAARAEAEQMHVAEALLDYAIELAQRSRLHQRVRLGLSTRGAIALIRAARVVAGIRGAEFVAPDDIKQVAGFVMPHRLVLQPEAGLEGDTDTSIVQALLASTPVPR